MTESLRTDLNDFLFSPVANDENGMHVTMLSALARSGVDPWDEAASLAALSQESATQKVVQMLGVVPNGPSPGDQTTSLAASLVAQLRVVAVISVDATNARPMDYLCAGDADFVGRRLPNAYQRLGSADA